MSDIWKTHSLSNGALTLTILPGIGGRLWDIAHNGTTLLFQNEDLDQAKVDLSKLTDLPSRSPQFEFPLWGGEKTWIAPDRDWTRNAPSPTLDSAPYHVLAEAPDTIVMQSDICPQTQLQITRQITLTSTQSWMLTHKVTNHGTAPRYTGIWSVMMLKHPTEIALDTGDTASITPVFGDARGFQTVKGTTIQYRCQHLGEFKTNIPNPKGVVAIKTGTEANPLYLCCETPLPQKDHTFAHGHSFEVFNSGDYPYCEAEWHSPAHWLAPNDTLAFEQHFSFHMAAETAKHQPHNLQELITCMS